MRKKNELICFLCTAAIQTYQHMQSREREERGVPSYDCSLVQDEVCSVPNVAAGLHLVSWASVVKETMPAFSPACSKVLHPDGLKSSSTDFSGTALALKHPWSGAYVHESL